MAFAELSAAGEDAVGTLNEPAKDKGRINPSGAHDPDGPQVWWILEP